MALPYAVRAVDRITVDADKTQLRALFDVEVPGLGVLKRCRYLENAEGEHFIFGPSALDPRVGGYPVFFEFEPDARRELADTVAEAYRKLRKPT